MTDLGQQLAASGFQTEIVQCWSACSKLLLLRGPVSTLQAGRNVVDLKALQLLHGCVARSPVRQSSCELIGYEGQVAQLWKGTILAPLCAQTSISCGVEAGVEAAQCWQRAKCERRASCCEQHAATASSRNGQTISYDAQPDFANSSI